MFQRTIENTLKGLAGTICFQDDVLVHGRTKSQCEKRWRAVQDRLKDKGFTINEIKSGTVMEKITFSVSQFQEAGLSPMIALSIKSGKSILLKVLRKSNIFVDWSTSTAGSSQTSRRKLPQYLI